MRTHDHTDQFQPSVGGLRCNRIIFQGSTNLTETEYRLEHDDDERENEAELKALKAKLKPYFHRVKHSRTQRRAFGAAHSEN